VAEQEAPDFGGLLRRLRAEAGLTQEELAGAARLSPRSVSDLERGINRTARKETARLLADALGLAGPVRAEFEAAARGRAPAGVPEVVRALPRDTAGFTGRAAELAELAAVAASAGGVVSICAIGGMAGIGKTTLAVHAAHQLAPQFPDGQIFVPLYGHTPGHHPADPADALASVLLLIGLTAQQIPPGIEARAGVWRDRAAGRRFLLVLDDAASSEQVRPLLPGAGDSLVLITSRRRLLGPEDARTISLDALPPQDAAALFTALAARPGLDRGDRAVGQITALCGFLPLAVGLLARQLHHHPAWTPDDLAASLASVRDRLPLLDSGERSVAAAFDLSYAELTAGQRRLFRRLGLHPGPDIDEYAAAALDRSDLGAARQGLAVLYDHYLLTEPAAGRYRFHDLIREHARALAARDDPPDDRDQATGRLLDYYQHAAARADALIVPQVRTIPAPVAGAPAAVPALADREQAVAWTRAERANLIACLDRATAAGQHARVTALTAGLAALMRSDGPWAEAITRHTAAVQAARCLGDRFGQAGALTDLGVVRWLTGDYPTALKVFEQALGICRDLGDRRGEARALSNLGAAWSETGDYPAAAQALDWALDIYRDLGNRLGQADTLARLGVLRRRTGDYPAAAQVLGQALDTYRDLGDREGEADALNKTGTLHRVSGDLAQAEGCHQRALELARTIASTWNEAHALAGLSRCATADGHTGQARVLLQQALEIFQQIGATDAPEVATELDAITDPQPPSPEHDARRQ
jgi:tetratricopeptide (TPR) repeat protein/transcriptional regulator with XRE-family HTH domain